MIDLNKFQNTLDSIFEKNGASRFLTVDVKDKLTVLADYMLTENEKYNLTAIKNPAAIAAFHFLDSFLPAELIPQGCRVADVGCGAGFPSLPLAILRPDVTITSIDSTEKKINFVNSAATILELTNIKAMCARAEDAARYPEMRESFDVATARAVSELRVLSELCIPLVKKGGIFIAMKGKNAETELATAQNALSVFNMHLVRTQKTEIYLNEDKSLRINYVFEKLSSTPMKYPRNYSQISKKPL